MPNTTKQAHGAISDFTAWFDGLKTHAAAGGPARGTIAAALVVLDQLKTDFDLDLDTHRASGKSQIKGVGQAKVAKILADFGETRPFLKEGGRTNRGGPGDIEKMLAAIRKMRLETLSNSKRIALIREMQSFLVEKIREFHNRQRIKLTYDPSRSAWEVIRELLALAKEQGKEGPVAQYLVGAKLQLRFPKLKVENKSYSTADEQLGRAGDFRLGDTAFHVTVAPMDALCRKCKTNLDAGLMVYLIVPDRVLAGARTGLETHGIEKKVNVASVESFVSQNISELSTFLRPALANEIVRLFDEYNSRVSQVENDRSMLVELPPLLVKRR